MPVKAEQFTAASVRKEWDAAAAAYVEAQSTGRDFYRLEVFGPAQIELCGRTKGLRLLDVGCGAGYFSRAMADGGASVTGIDISAEMIRHASEIESRQPRAIRYVLGDASDLRLHFQPQSFDIATSCLALQDMPDINSVLCSVRDALVPGGRFVVSIAHPCTDTPFRRWQKNASGERQCLCIDRYFDRGPITYRWKDWAYEFTTSSMHATLEDWIEWFTAAGFSLRALREPSPTPEAISRLPELQDCARVPYFLLLAFERRQPGEDGHERTSTPLPQFSR